MPAIQRLRCGGRLEIEHFATGRAHVYPTHRFVGNSSRHFACAQQRVPNAADPPWRSWRIGLWPTTCVPNARHRDRRVLSERSRPFRASLGTTKADKLTRLQLAGLHSSSSGTRFQANRVLAVVGSMYAFAGRAGIVAEATNPARGIDKFKESRHERFLTAEELKRLGNAIFEAETTGIPWTVADETKATAKHVRRKSALRGSHQPRPRRCGCCCSPVAVCGKSFTCGGSTSISSGAASSCHTAKVAGILNAPALAVLTSLEPVSTYVVPGDNLEKPRHDLKRP